MQSSSLAICEIEDPEDDRKVVEHMYSSLRTGGKFLIETMGKEILAREFQER
jgi:hypothetical protein